MGALGSVDDVSGYHQCETCDNVLLHKYVLATIPSVCSFFDIGILQALGGMVVGLVTKYAGGVVKGFALIAGMYASFLYSISIFLRCNLLYVWDMVIGTHKHPL